MSQSNAHTITIALPEPLTEFVQAEAARRGYPSAAQYVEDLVQAEQRRQAAERLDQLLLDGLNSGEPIEVTPEYWDHKRKELSERLEKTKGQ